MGVFKFCVYETWCPRHKAKFSRRGALFISKALFSLACDKKKRWAGDKRALAYSATPVGYKINPAERIRPQVWCRRPNLIIMHEAAVKKIQPRLLKRNVSGGRVFLVPLRFYNYFLITLLLVCRRRGFFARDHIIPQRLPLFVPGLRTF